MWVHLQSSCCDVDLHIHKWRVESAPTGFSIVTCQNLERDHCRLLSTHARFAIYKVCAEPDSDRGVRLADRRPWLSLAMLSLSCASSLQFN